jgi:hypothetical protein
VQQRSKASGSKGQKIHEHHAFLLFAVIGIAPTTAAPQIQAADEHADIYSIYSLMMTNPATSHGPSTDDVFIDCRNSAAGGRIRLALKSHEERLVASSKACANEG